MITVSAKSEYGLSFLAYLAKNKDLPAQAGRFVSLSEVAEKENISQGYLEEIAAILNKAGFLQGKKGKGGGYVLAQDPKDIKISDVVTALEGPISPVKCMGSGKCFKEKICGAKSVWVSLKEKIDEHLSEISLADITS